MLGHLVALSPSNSPLDGRRQRPFGHLHAEGKGSSGSVARVKNDSSHVRYSKRSGSTTVFGTYAEASNGRTSIESAQKDRSIRSRGEGVGSPAPTTPRGRGVDAREGRRTLRPRPE